jgi:hypothetical protein
MWTLAYGDHEDRTPTHGYEATREAAMKALRDEVAPFHCLMPPVLPSERIAHLSRDCCAAGFRSSLCRLGVKTSNAQNEQV